ncbi:MAG: response regulator [Marinifilaceae bacterium]
MMVDFKRSNKRVLVCDDDLEWLTLIEQELQKKGFEVLLASNGRQALDVIQTQSFDLIVTELLLPSVSGFELIFSVRNRLPGLVPTIVVSKLKTAYAIQKTQELSIHQYLTKPADVKELVDHVVNLLS